MFTVSEISHELGRATWQDYLEICKPRVVLLMLLCTLVGMLLATHDVVPCIIVIFGILFMFWTFVVLLCYFAFHG